MKHILILILLPSAIASSNGKTDQVPQGDTQNNPQPVAKEIRDSNIYAIVVNGSTVSLRQWDTLINLKAVLGNPIKEVVQQLDKNADTHSGAFIKHVEFPGLKLKLYSPPQNGRAFWIQEMILTDSSYQTSRGIQLNDAIDEVKRAYPEIQPFPGENENMYYVADAGYEHSIEFEFAGGKLSRLRMYYMIP